MEIARNTPVLLYGKGGDWSIYMDPSLILSKIIIFLFYLEQISYSTVKLNDRAPEITFVANEKNVNLSFLFSYDPPNFMSILET